MLYCCLPSSFFPWLPFCPSSSNAFVRFPGWWSSLGRFQLNWQLYFKELLKLYPVGISVAVPVPKKNVFCHLSVKLFLKKKDISISESCVTFQRFFAPKTNGQACAWRCPYTLWVLIPTFWACNVPSDNPKPETWVQRVWAYGNPFFPQTLRKRWIEPQADCRQGGKQYLCTA